MSNHDIIDTANRSCFSCINDDMVAVFGLISDQATVRRMLQLGGALNRESVEVEKLYFTSDCIVYDGLTGEGGRRRARFNAPLTLTAPFHPLGAGKIPAGFPVSAQLLLKFI